MNPLLDGVKERKLVQWTLAYLAAAWLLIEAIDLLAGQFGWPAAVPRMVTLLLAVGLLAALVLAWYHGERGAQKVSGVELLMLTGILVIAAAAVAFVGGGTRAGESGEAAAEQGAASAAPSEPVPEQGSIAVLPFINLSGDPAQEYFSDGVTEELLNALAQVPGLRVAARTSSFAFKDKAVPVPEVARQLQVAHVLEGSVRQAGTRIKVTAQLVSATDGYHLWSQTYDRELRDVFAVQEDISRAIVDALQVELGGEVGRSLVNTTTENLQAYQLYLQGRHLWNQFTPANARKAMDFFRRAIELDPSYARAYAGLADAHVILANFGWAGTREGYPKAKEAVRRALALDSTLAEAHTSLAGVLFWYDRDWPGAEREFRRAAELNPNYALTPHWYGIYLNAMGRHAEAEAEALRARQLDPLAPQIGAGVAWHYYWVRRYDLAVEEIHRVLEINPDFANAYSLLGWAHATAGRFEESIAAFRRAGELLGAEPTFGLAYTYARAGQNDEARRLLARALKRPAVAYAQTTEIAFAYAALGELDEAFRWLERGFAERDPNLPWIATWPPADPLRADPRYAVMLRRLKLQ